MDIPAQKFFAWSGPVSLLLFFIGSSFAGFLVPISPSASAAHVASLYRANSHGIGVGAILILFSVAPFLLFVTVLSAQIKRIEGDRRTFTYAQLAAGTASMVPIILIPLFWTVAAFRPERSDEVIQLLNDLSLINQAMVTPPLMIQELAVGLAILSDKRNRPAFPRWMGYFSIVCAVACLPGLFCGLYNTGPFAWDGMIASASMLFLPWTLLMAFLLTKAIARQGAES